MSVWRFPQRAKNQNLRSPEATTLIPRGIASPYMRSSPWMSVWSKRATSTLSLTSSAGAA
ncbi:hypothetical protein GBA52_004399 [Prunus armeniaca]|nr:hypothetical protein GBA52_004399 [Prunus armeniaca]